MIISIRSRATESNAIGVLRNTHQRSRWGFGPLGTAAFVLGLAASAGAAEPALAQEKAAASPPGTVGSASAAASDDSAASRPQPERSSADSSFGASSSSDTPAPPDNLPSTDRPASADRPASFDAPRPASADQSDTPRSWFELYGLDESHFAKFVWGRPLDADEVEPLLKVIFRMRRFTHEQLAKWTRRDWSPEELAKQPQTHQTEVFRLLGRAVEVEAVKPAEEVASLFEMPEYYRCRIELASGARADVYSASVPRAWLAGSGALPARCEAAGVFLKTATAGERPELVFAAARVAWFPPTPLGDLGFDYGLFDQVVDRDPPEREPFHELLAAVGRSKSGELDRIAREQLKQLTAQKANQAPPSEGQGAIVRPAPDGSWFYSVVPLFHDSEASRGRLVTLEGIARQVQKVVIDEPEIRQRYGLDHYYQVSLFTADSGVNPVIFCVLELPEGMPIGARDRYGEKIRVSGFMFKLWSYRIDIPRGADEDSKTGRMRQRAPLLIARDLTWFPAPPPPPRSSLAAIIGLGFLAAATLLGWWALRRSDRRQAKPRHAETVERFQLPSAADDSPAETAPQNASSDPPPADPPPSDPTPSAPESRSENDTDAPSANGR